MIYVKANHTMYQGEYCVVFYIVDNLTNKAYNRKRVDYRPDYAKTPRENVTHMAVQYLMGLSMRRLEEGQAQGCFGDVGRLSLGNTTYIMFDEKPSKNSPRVLPRVNTPQELN